MKRQWPFSILKTWKMPLQICGAHQLNYMCLEFDHFGQIPDKCQTNVRQISNKFQKNMFMSYHHHMSICFSVRVLSISFFAVSDTVAYQSMSYVSSSSINYHLLLRIVSSLHSLVSQLCLTERRDMLHRNGSTQNFIMC